jgi:hypothetical protein
LRPSRNSIQTIRSLPSRLIDTDYHYTKLIQITIILKHGVKKKYFNQIIAPDQEFFVKLLTLKVSAKSGEGYNLIVPL